MLEWIIVGGGYGAFLLTGKFVLPIIVLRKLEGRNATNNPLWTVLDPTAPRPIAVGMQEVWEAQHKFFSLFLFPWRAARMVFDSERFKIDMELMGHEVEVQTARRIYGENEARHRYLEALGMLRHRNYDFGDMKIGDILAGMMENRSRADRWVRRNERWSDRITRKLVERGTR